MWVAGCLIDSRGRLTLPKSFMKANKLDEFTKVMISTMQNTNNSVKLTIITKEELLTKLEANR